MAPAWQVRELERQRLVEKLFELVHEEADEWDNRAFIFLNLATVLTQWLYEIVAHPEKDFFDLKERLLFAHIEMPAVLASLHKKHNLCRKIMTGINQFARAPGEKHLLLCLLLEKVLSSATSSFYAEIRRLEIHEPRIIFGVESATVEVVIPDGEEETD